MAREADGTCCRGLARIGRDALACGFAAVLSAAGLAAQAPSLAPATVGGEAGRVVLTYDGHALLDGVLQGVDARTEFVSLVDTAGGRITQVLKWTARSRTPLSLVAAVRTGDEGFPVEADRREDGPALIRSSVGLSWSRLNRAVYDRGRDWVLSVDFPARVRVTPLDSSAEGIRFRIEASGGEVALRFRPHFVRTHRGLAAFEPWRYRAWRPSVAGWTSWFAFRDGVTEADVRRTADAVAEVLAPFGYQIVQIDDGFQRSPIGMPANWLEANAKFPAGLPGLVRSITGRGLIPGLWTNTTFHQRDWAEAHPQYFVRRPDGGPAYGNWVGFVMDGSAPGTLDSLVRPVYRELRRMGWRYFKVDALRHLRYEGYNSYRDAFRARGVDPLAAYRGFVQAIRDEVGPESFLLGSWGIRPELVGLLDACRVGDDGFGFGGFAQYNSFNNVVWRNDPDHIELTTDDAFRATMATSLTGSLLMLTDRPEVYRTERAEAAKRAAPVLFALPGQLYDVDPSRSQLIGLASAEVSGAGPRPFDADQVASVHLYLTEVARPFERWVVLGRTGGERRTLRFADLGLAPDSAYLVFEFWTRTFHGALRDSFDVGEMAPRFGAQLFCLRTQRAQPQVVATTRHVSCGGVDLVSVTWGGDALSGVSDVVGGDDYAVYVTEPAGYRAAGATADGARVLGFERAGGVRVLRLRAGAASRVTWRIRYTRAGGAGGRP